MIGVKFLKMFLREIKDLFYTFLLSVEHILPVSIVSSKLYSKMLIGVYPDTVSEYCVFCKQFIYIFNKSDKYCQ